MANNKTYSKRATPLGIFSGVALFFFQYGVIASEKSGNGTPFDFSRRVQEDIKFSAQEEIRVLFERVCSQCKSAQEGAPCQEVMDLVRQLVAADDRYKVENKPLEAFFLEKPILRDTFLMTTSFAAGCGFWWLFVSQ